MRDQSALAVPDRLREREWQACGFCRVAGVDEVGRGPIAGPVAAGAVILPHADVAWAAELRDSKLMSPRQREKLAAHIWTDSVAAAVGFVSPAEIDRTGIAPASREAMRRAVKGLRPRPAALLLDAFHLPEVPLPQEAIIRGDRRCSAIAAASIIAKVARDLLMELYGAQHPGYGLERHRGYATAEHLESLLRLGPLPLHRRSFAPLRADTGTSAMDRD